MGGDTIAWEPPPKQITLQEAEVAQSEEEMLRSTRTIGDRIFRLDLGQTFLFAGGDPDDPRSYYRLFDIVETVREESPSFGEIEIAQQEWLTATRIYEQSILLNGGVPASVIEPATNDNRATPSQPEEPEILVVNLTDCKFYGGSSYLRCAVNPCATTCDGCRSFKSKY
jgi:hypothetical protein